MDLSHLQHTLKTQISTVEAQECRLKDWLESLNKFEHNMQRSAEIEVNSEIQRLL